jgi:hypothetical protein
MIKTYLLIIGLGTLLLFAGCDRVASRGPSAILELIDAQSDIYGNWRAEEVSVGGVGLSLAPSLEFTREHIVLGGEITPVARYEVMEASSQNPKIVKVHLSSGPSLTFELMDSENMTFKLPIGAVNYRKVK